MSQTIDASECATPHHPWPHPRLVVHRAGGTLAPENTRAAFECAVRLGCRAVEIDVMMTSDGELILSHDEELGRAVAADGNVGAMTASELLALDAGIRFGEKWRGTPMMLFAEAFDYCVANSLSINIEIKPAAGADEATARTLARMLTREADVLNSVWVSSFSMTALRAFRNERNDVALGILYETPEFDWQRLAMSLNASFVHPHETLVSSVMVERAHALGLGVMAWTVDEVTRARELRAAGVDALCTNRPDLMQKAGLW